ncbi:endo alpha-1,4 polygalactosaminidase [Marinobacter fonticola]|uniref:endo alpha-1,4 polygalactosaminidase n=1 Tax=Marinobacter fonticola TaxID=2603215 RepID=UPI0011E74644|nr:endo alpha-1,4 polygalactosaminidase [Marinobacter fonticola]
MRRYARLCIYSIGLLAFSASAFGAIVATASSDNGYVPANTLDGSLAGWSRWTSKGDGEWIRFDLGETRVLKAVDLAFQRGDVREYYFDLQASSDGENWTPLIEDTASSGQTRNFERVDVPDTQTRYVRYIGWGNNDNLLNSLTEVRFQSTAVEPVEPPVTGDWWQPQSGMSWQWQLQGTINTGYSVQVYDIDLFDTPVEMIESLQHSGQKVVCYFSAGSFEDWRPDADHFAAGDLGDPMGEWEGENWLDIRTQNVRDIMTDRMLLAKAKGCDGVEPDNIDGYTNATGLPLTYADQLDYNRFLAETAHRLELAIALKNDLSQVTDLVSHFDMAINEQCHKYNECHLLQPFIDAGKPVFNAEYGSKYVNDPAARDALCASSRLFGMHTLILPLALDDGFRLDCGID